MVMGRRAWLGITATLFCLVFGSLAADGPSALRVIPVKGPFLVEHDGFLVCYDGRTRNPVWVYECLQPEHLTGKAVRREAFTKDPSLPSPIQPSLQSYQKSRYDRGHLAAAANHKHDQKAMDETFLLSNVAPQVGIGFNRQGGIWARLENAIREIALQSHRTHVITGPLYLPSQDPSGERYVKYTVIGTDDVAVPTHYFKVIIAVSPDGRYEESAYLMPNLTKSAHTELEGYRVEPDDALRLAGIVLDRSVLLADDTHTANYAPPNDPCSETASPSLFDGDVQLIEK